MIRPTLICALALVACYRGADTPPTAAPPPRAAGPERPSRESYSITSTGEVVRLDLEHGRMTRLFAIPIEANRVTSIAEIERQLLVCVPEPLGGGALASIDLETGAQENLRRRCNAVAADGARLWLLSSSFAGNATLEEYDSIAALRSGSPPLYQLPLRLQGVTMLAASNGELYADWLDGHALAQIDLETGAATPLPMAITRDAPSSGFAVTRSEVYVVDRGVRGVRVHDRETGELRRTLFADPPEGWSLHGLSQPRLRRGPPARPTASRP